MPSGVHRIIDERYSTFQADMLTLRKNQRSRKAAKPLVLGKPRYLKGTKTSGALGRERVTKPRQ